MEAQTTWTALRQNLKTNGITEQQYYDWLVKNTKPPIVDEVLRLIVNHVYHSDEERLIAPPHLRVDKMVIIRFYIRSNSIHLCKNGTLNYFSANGTLFISSFVYPIMFASFIIFHSSNELLGNKDNENVR